MEMNCGLCEKIISTADFDHSTKLYNIFDSKGKLVATAPREIRWKEWWVLDVEEHMMHAEKCTKCYPEEVPIDVLSAHVNCNPSGKAPDIEPDGF
jgi:hypothetical protein